MSSDSEDDCYGNIAQRLQSMKNKFQEDKLESTNLLDITSDKRAADKTSSHVKVVENNDTSVNISINTDNDNDDLTLDTIIARNSNRRLTRSMKNSKDESIPELPKRGRGRGGKGRGRGGKGRGRQSTAEPVAEPELPQGYCRGRGRASIPAAASHSRGRRRIADVLSSYSNIVYSVGNTDEYPDHSDGQAMFTSQPVDVVMLQDCDPLDDNEELSVKVYWQSSEFFKFTIRRYQKLTELFDYFAQKENVHTDNLLFTYNDKILRVDDTPDSIGYAIVRFIDGGVTNNSISQIVTKDSKIKDSKIKDGIKIKFQCLNTRKPFEIFIRHDDKLSLAMMKCAEQLEIPMKRLKFLFDGDSLAGSMTPRQLELEGGECIDVKIIS